MRTRLGSQSRNQPTKNSRASDRKKNFPIVGIGASAGGLEAFQRLLSKLPLNTGMAFVLVQHLSPNHSSLLPEILSRVTKMPVTQVKSGTVVCPNRIYVIPPGQSMNIRTGVLYLAAAPGNGHPSFAIDLFLKSLGEDQKSEAIGVILSGTGTDGAEGLKALKGAGGITFAQSPESAKHEGMPARAIAVDHVDFVLSPEEIAQELVKISRHPYVRMSSEKLVWGKESELKGKNTYQDIVFSLKNSTGVDFSQYKYATVQRRIFRRMALAKVDDVDQYIKILKRDPNEQIVLHNDILIGVTSFFRDPEAFEKLAEKVLPALLKHKALNDPVRIWVAGCSTGEEVYSIAILILEAMGKKTKTEKVPIQIFATDLNEDCLAKARLATYPDAIVENLSKTRLNRFFVKSDQGYKVIKQIRDLCVFAKHDLAVDPPFSRVDLVSCRNVLIYMQPSLQKKVLATFYYALKPGGFLFLGSSESPGASSGFFKSVEKTNKIYITVATQKKRRPEFSTVRRGLQRVTIGKLAGVTQTEDAELEKETHRLILNKIAPCSVLVNENSEILSFYGDSSPFLTSPSGKASFNLFRMARPGFSLDLEEVLKAAKTRNVPIKRVLTLKHGPRIKRISLEVYPVRGSLREGYSFLVAFRELEPSVQLSSKRGQGSTKKNGIESARVRELTQDLISTRASLEALNRSLETANQDLQSANEEVLSSNEELQSTNEEIETAKEELQSTNEELSTVNDELQSRNKELDRLSNDLLNLLESVEIPILMVDRKMRIRRYTPIAEKMLNLIPTDIGRPINDIRSNFEALHLDINLSLRAEETIKSGKRADTEVQDRAGHWYRLQVRPYRTLDKKIDGAVIALIDINFLKMAVSDLQEARNEAEKAQKEAEAGNRAKDIFIATLSHELRTPLTTILTYSQMMRMGKLNAEKADHGIRIIEQNALTQKQLIDDLLDVSRIIMGKLSVALEDVNPSVVLKAAIDAVQPTAEAKSIQIETTIDAANNFVSADPVRLRQVFWNLLNNAIKFSSPGSIVKTRLEYLIEKGALVRVQVQDTGKGINPAFLPHIFDRFRQEESSNTRSYGGLGLGLAIVRSLVETFGGTVWAESRGTEKGATFVVQLPLKKVGKVSAGAPFGLSVPERSINEEPAGLNGIRVLLVDDESDAREALALLLQSFGAEVKTAASVDEAVSGMDQSLPDVLISDIAMPLEDGYSLIHKLRALEHGKDIPAIALSALAGKEDVGRALAAGFQIHLEKPVNGIHLINVVARIARKNKKNRSEAK